MTSTHYTRIDSAVGPLLLVATERGLSGLHFEGTRHGPCIESHWQPGKDRFAEVIGQLGEYFAGTRSSFTFPLDLSGTDFQLDVWNALCGIGYGSTTSYGEIARRVHRPAAVRAVGMANGRNPVAVVV